MKFLPVKEGNTAMLMRLPARRLSLKVYIENTMIPDIIAYEGSEFLSSLFWGAQPFVCDLYNSVWEQYAQERPFNISDFRVFDAESEKREILYVEVPVLPGLEEICSCALAFASDVSDCRRVNIRSYRIQRHRIDDGQVVFEVFGKRSIIPRYRKAVVPGTHTAENHDLISSDQGSRSSTSKSLLCSARSGNMLSR